MVAKAANVLEERIDLSGYAITNVSSLRSNLVADFAKRLANKLGLKYVDYSIPQKLILVDDVVDSKWTLTVCGYLLMQAGCEQVVPFALADSSSKE